MPADSGLGVSHRHPLPDADSEGPVPLSVVGPQVPAAPSKDSTAHVPDQLNKFMQPETLGA